MFKENTMDGVLWRIFLWKWIRREELRSILHFHKDVPLLCCLYLLQYDPLLNNSCPGQNLYSAECTLLQICLFSVPYFVDWRFESTHRDRDLSHYSSLGILTCMCGLEGYSLRGCRTHSFKHLIYHWPLGISLERCSAESIWSPFGNMLI